MAKVKGLFSMGSPARWVAALLGGAVCALAQPATLLKEVRFWSSVDTTRIAIETTQEVDFKHGLTENSSRLYIDLVDVQPKASFRGLAYSIPVEDGLIKRIRVAPNQASVTRVVLDLTGPVEITTGKLVNPPRIVVDVRRAGPGPAPEPAVAPVSRLPQPITQQQQPAAAPPPSPIVQAAKPDPLPAPASAVAVAKPALREPPKASTPMLAAASVLGKFAPLPAVALTVTPPSTKPEPPPPTSGRIAQAARLSTPSLTRALGLKLRRVVLDAGHGGIDPGSDGPTGLVEKELLLDITLRLGRLLQERAGIEVLFTRKDDSFVDLHERAPFANRAKADLFLSIHANTAPVRSVIGAETYYLNRGESKADLAVATRENATSAKSMFELGDLVRKIVADDKRDESRQFATHIQAATHEFSVRTHGRVYNRGVRHAPFAVLIGATMPAVLVEVGFISNPKEEALLKKSDYRQKMAEALYKGVLSYSNSLSHYAMVQAED